MFHIMTGVFYRAVRPNYPRMPCGLHEKMAVQLN